VAVVAGATGLVGRAVLDLLLPDKTWSAVHAVGRGAPDIAHPKLTQHTVDSFDDFIAPPASEAFIALGTTIRTAGSREAFRAVDLDAVVSLARAARAAGAVRLAAVSAMGANSRSRVFYNRVKGEMEDAVCGLGFETVVIARPSLLAGDRERLGQPGRSGERLALAAFGFFDAVIPANYRAIGADHVARALVDGMKRGQRGCHVLLSGELQRY
jgi:uncharacterized protein YbjT (DUF2867 family)